MNARTTIILATLALSACATTPPSTERVRVVRTPPIGADVVLVEAHRAAWVDAPYEARPHDAWYADVAGDCKGKALAIRDMLEPLGYNVTFRLGCRTDVAGNVVDGVCDAYGGAMHIVPVIDGEYIIDGDGIWVPSALPWQTFPVEPLDLPDEVTRALAPGWLMTAHY